MAKVKFTAFMADARGKLNGTVFSKNRGGSYTRTKVTPSNPQTSFQAAVRQRLSSLSAQFRSLTAAQILGWNNAVSDFQSTNVFGDTVNPTGLQLYVKLNANLLGIGAATISDPPAPTAISSITATIASLTTAAFTASLAAATTDETYVIEATQPVSPGRLFLKNEFRVITTVAGTGVAIPAQDLFAAYTAKFGTPVSGQRVGLRVKLINETTGQAGIYVNDNEIVA